mmetsp:Transcript_120926/g.170124  ORF Transcript_120926/g.170124 Transcript_120926/m.170124 type:complete len:262 (+) Transcript_120926:1153-1938(+)
MELAWSMMRCTRLVPRSWPSCTRASPAIRKNFISTLYVAPEEEINTWKGVSPALEAWSMSSTPIVCRRESWTSSDTWRVPGLLKRCLKRYTTGAMPSSFLTRVLTPCRPMSTRMALAGLGSPKEQAMPKREFPFSYLCSSTPLPTNWTMAVTHVSALQSMAVRRNSVVFSLRRSSLMNFMATFSTLLFDTRQLCSTTSTSAWSSTSGRHVRALTSCSNSNTEVACSSTFLTSTTACSIAHCHASLPRGPFPSRVTALGRLL